MIVKVFEGENQPVLSIQEQGIFSCGFAALMGLSSVQSDLSRYGDRYSNC